MTTERAPDCLRCGRRMEVGFVPTLAGGSRGQSHWVPGLPEWSRWHGLRLRGRPQLPVVTYRCPKCGCLDAFARAP